MKKVKTSKKRVAEPEYWKKTKKEKKNKQKKKKTMKFSLFQKNLKN